MYVFDIAKIFVLFLQLSTGLNISDAGTRLVASRAVTNDTVSLTFRLSFNITNLASTGQAIIRDSLLTWLNESSTLGNYTLVTNDTGYQGFMISGRQYVFLAVFLALERPGLNVIMWIRDPCGLILSA